MRNQNALLIVWKCINFVFVISIYSVARIIEFKELSRQSDITKGHEGYRSYGGCTIFLRSTKTEKLRGPCYITNSLLFWYGGTYSFNNCQIFCKRARLHTFLSHTVLQFVKKCSRVHVQNLSDQGMCQNISWTLVKRWAETESLD